MKKLLAILLALGLVLVSVAALADGELPEVPQNADDILFETADAEATPEYFITKTYTSDVEGLYPVETLKFEVEKGNNSNPNITVADFAVDGKSDTYQIPVEVPAASVYGTAGVYTYTVKEKAPTNPSQGVIYDAGEDGTVFNVDVYVYFKNTAAAGEEAKIELVREAIIYSGASPSTETKAEAFENEYEVGNLTVSKEIDGNLADPELPFTIEVTLTPTAAVTTDITISSDNGGVAYDSTAPTTAITKIAAGTGWNTAKTILVVVQGGQSVKFENIPAGVTYSAVEKKAGSDNLVTIDDTDAAQIAAANNPAAYAVTTTYSDDTNKAIASEDDDTIEITNKKAITVPTGITLDFVPYVMIIALAGIALMALKARKKEN